MEGKFKDQIQQSAVIAFLLSISSLAFITLWLSFYEKPSLMYLNVPFPIVNPIVYPGAPLPVKVDKCNRSSKKTTYMVIRHLKSTNGNVSIILQPEVFELAPGCTFGINHNILPREIVPGHYFLIGTSQVQDPLGSPVVPWSTKEFQVIDLE